MDDFFCRFTCDCCDVALVKHFTTSIFDPDAVTKLLNNQEKALEQSIGKIYPSGTCFVISKPNNEIKVNERKVMAFALTNYHVAYSMTTNLPNKLMFAVLHLSNEQKELSFNCEVLTEFHTKASGDHFSDRTRQPYCYPSDVVILILYSYDKKTEESITDY